MLFAENIVMHTILLKLCRWCFWSLY